MRITYIGTATALLELGGLRLLTDPALGGPGEYPSGRRALLRTIAPALTAEQLPDIDAVLLSHDEHPDNLDDAGRALLPRAGTVITTEAGAQRLGGNAVGVPSWRHVELPRSEGGALRITAVPAQHGPDGTEALTGPVTGFVLTGDGLPTVYIGGDNASLRAVDEVRRHVAPPIDVAILNAGGARTALLDAYLTFPAAQVAEAALLLDARRVIVLHAEGWAHFTSDWPSVLTAFAEAGLGDRLVPLPPGEPVDVLA